MKLCSRPAGHFYSERRLLYPSVTTILHQIPNPGLDAWKLRVPHWRKISAAATRTGTEVHKEIEHTLMGKHPKVKHKMQVKAFLSWQKEIGFKVQRTEMKVRSKVGYAGTLDLLGYIDNTLFVIDLKTSKQIYPEMLLQLSAYKYAFMEMQVQTYVEIGVLRIDKKEEAVEWMQYTEEEYNRGIAEFLQLCTKWHKEHNTQEEYEKRFIIED